MSDLISKSALLKRIDEEREYLKARGLLGAEHILTHNFRELVEDAPTVDDRTREVLSLQETIRKLTKGE